MHTIESAIILMMKENFCLEDDRYFFTSIARQCGRNLALTSRQHELIKNKIEPYRTKFLEYNIDITVVRDKLKYPYRSIDREHYVRYETHNDVDCIVIRFPFSKRIIKRIEELKEIIDTAHDYTEHKHIFQISEKTVLGVVNVANRFEAKFNIAEDVLEDYKKVLELENQKEELIPTLRNFKFVNLPEVCQEQIIKDCGEPNKSNLLKYFDRAELYGLRIDHSWQECNDVGYLTRRLVERTKSDVKILSSSFSLNAVAGSLYELDRFPLLVSCDVSGKGQVDTDPVVDIFKAFNGVVPASQQSVLFRLDGDHPFNSWVKENGLNNPVDKNTKIVYINDNKVPKPLVNSDFWPSACLRIDHNAFARKADTYTNGVDLRIVHSDNDNNSWHYTNRDWYETIK